jgi:hypothetical protein
MNRKAKGMTGAAFLSLALVVTSCTPAPEVISQTPKEFDPLTAPLCSIKNETSSKIMLKIVAGPPTTGGSYTIYPKGEKLDSTSIYCHSKVEIYAQVSKRPIETVVIDEPGVISLKRQKPSFSRVSI